MSTVLHDDHVRSCDHSNTGDGDMTTSTTLYTRITDQMENIIDIRCVTVTPWCVITCIHVTSYMSLGNMMYHIMFEWLLILKLMWYVLMYIIM